MFCLCVLNITCALRYHPSDSLPGHSQKLGRWWPWVKPRRAWAKMNSFFLTLVSLGYSVTAIGLTDTGGSNGMDLLSFMQQGNTQIALGICISHWKYPDCGIMSKKRKKKCIILRPARDVKATRMQYTDCKSQRGVWMEEAGQLQGRSLIPLELNWRLSIEKQRC